MHSDDAIKPAHAADPRAPELPAPELPARGPDAARPVPLSTRRLLLRPLRTGDAPAIARYAGDWDVARMTGRIPYPYSRAMAEDWIAELGPDEGVWVIVSRDGSAHPPREALIGACGYVLSPDGSAEIGYWLAKHAWGQGYATEATSKLVEHCFRTLRFPKLTCSHFIDNQASARVIAKLGFRPAGTTIAHADARREDVRALTYARRRPLLSRFASLDSLIRSAP